MPTCAIAYIKSPDRVGRGMIQYSVNAVVGAVGVSSLNAHICPLRPTNCVQYPPVFQVELLEVSIFDCRDDTAWLLAVATTAGVQ
jgi:hypothetical protein